MDHLNGDCVPMLRTLINPARAGREGHPDYLSEELKNQFRNDLAGQIRARLPHVPRYDAWYLEYYELPYMHHLSRREFTVRWCDVFRNLTTITEDNKIGVGDPRENRWMACFSHLLAEAQFRGGVPRDASSMAGHDGAFEFTKHPRKNPPASSWKRPYIYKFGDRRWLERSLGSGEIRFVAASYYDNASLNDAQRDKESEFNFAVSPEYLRGVSGLTGMAKIDETISRSGFEIHHRHDSDFLIWCASTQFDPRVHYGFGYNSVLIIKDKKRFNQAIAKSIREKAPSWKYEFGPVKYLDPMLDFTKNISVPFSKHFRYEYQSEYRGCIFGPNLPSEIYAEVPKLDQFAEILDIPTNTES